MRTFMTEIKAINASEAIAQNFKDNSFTRAEYNKERKEKHLPSIAFARNHNLIKVVKEEPIQFQRKGKTINGKRYFYALNTEKYKEIMAFMQTRTGLKKRLKKCAYRMQENTAKMKMLADYNAEIETFLSLVGQW